MKKHHSILDKDQRDEIELLRCCRRLSPSCEAEADNVEDREVEVEEKGSVVKDQTIGKVKNNFGGIHGCLHTFRSKKVFCSHQLIRAEA
jgi:hypothetical protein